MKTRRFEFAMGRLARDDGQSTKPRSDPKSHGQSSAVIRSLDTVVSWLVPTGMKFGLNRRRDGGENAAQDLCRERVCRAVAGRAVPLAAQSISVLDNWSARRYCSTRKL